jgi:hypothetical protein
MISPTPSSSNRRPYDQDLRLIGQALEAKRINVFELKAQEDQYVVRGKPEKDVSVLGTLRNWRERMSGRLDQPINFPAPDLERLDKEGKAKRTKANRLPDFYSLSNTLRTVGYYLEAKGAQLLEIHKGSLNIALLYQDKNGHPNLEERPIASFYNFFVALHGRRRQRERG